MCESCFTDKLERKATGLTDFNQHIITALYRLALHKRSRCAEARLPGLPVLIKCLPAVVYLQQQTFVIHDLIKPDSSSDIAVSRQ